MVRWLVVPLWVGIAIAACAEDASEPAAAPPSAEEKPDAASVKSSPVIADASVVTTEAPPPADEKEPEKEPAEEHEGEATYFAAGSLGACGTKTPADKLVGALGPSTYSKAACGQCAEVTGPKGTVTVVINDRCAGCKGESMDLSTQAFTQIASKSQGRVKITWHYVDCP